MWDGIFQEGEGIDRFIEDNSATERNKLGQKHTRFTLEWTFLEVNKRVQPSITNFYYYRIIMHFHNFIIL